jgi:serine/threonine protein kinase
MRLHPMHPAAWAVRATRKAGWRVHNLLAFTRASTLLLVSRDSEPPVVLKAGFGSNHVLAELDEEIRPAAYGFYWYQEMSPTERALSRKDFRHEMATTRAASGAHHVVPLLEEGSTEGLDWYTLPYCTDGNLRPILLELARHRKPDRISFALGILADTAAGLTALHDRGIVHRDVYQENILIHNGRGLITDLGAARHIAVPRGPSSRGPEVHWPPEYATSYDRATPAADVYSLAVLTYRVVCADLPRVHGAQRLAEAPAALRESLSAALAHDPAQRPTMTELHRALRDAAQVTAPSNRQQT